MRRARTIAPGPRCPASPSTSSIVTRARGVSRNYRSAEGERRADTVRLQAATPEPWPLTPEPLTPGPCSLTPASTIGKIGIDGESGMNRRPIPRRLLFVLTGLALVLWIGVAMIEALAMILGAMGDAPASQVVGWIALGIAVLLAVDLICLVLALAINALADSDEPPEGP